jgi:peptide deformylase
MIITNNENALRVKCEDVSLDEVGELIDLLQNELNHSNSIGNRGIGLAAPQIGIAKNIAIVRLGNGIDVNLINSKIINSYDATIFRDEGCLSFPGRVEDTTRYQEVHIVNNLTYPNSFIARGLFAVVCQHEIDHFNSTLFIDKVVKPNTLVKKIGPNLPCICGSNKKYKKCCGAK